MVFQTEYEFTLPKGFVDEAGNLHKKGTMRLANAADEILPLRDPRVQQNPGYLTIILLSRVITRLGSLKAIDTTVVEKLFIADLSYLQNFYQQINEGEIPQISVVCPKCQHEFSVEVNDLGEFGE
ncbi:MAG: phage tail assembly protein [Syntrophomonas sp.]